MAAKRAESEVPSFESESDAPDIMPVEPRVEEAGSMLAEVSTEADVEAVRTMAEESVEPAEATESNPPVPEPTEAVVPVATAVEDNYTGGFVHMVKERSAGEHTPYMCIQRNFIEKEKADKKLFSDENHGVTRSLPDSRIGMLALESAAKDLNSYVESMRRFYRDHPNEKDWKHHEPPKGLGIRHGEHRWEHHNNNLHYWNDAREFGEPQQRMLLVPVHHYTPEGPRRGLVGISFQEHYDREEMVFQEHPERQKEARKESWKIGEYEAEATAGTASAEPATEAAAGIPTASGSGETPEEPATEAVIVEQP